MTPVPISLPPFFKGSKLSITPILFAVSFLFFCDLWTHIFNLPPLLKWDYSRENIPNLLFHFLFLALPYAILFRLGNPVFLLELRLATIGFFSGHTATQVEVSEESYIRYASETNNSTALKALEENRAAREHTLWSVFLISLSILLFVFDSALCRHTEGTFAHLVIPTKITAWIPVLGFLAYLGFLLGWCMNGWGIEPSGMPVTKALREEIKKREGQNEIRT